MSDSDLTHQRESSAGPYGFSRREIVALTVVMLIAFGIAAYDTWREGSTRNTPAWVIDDVVIDQRETVHAEQQADTTSARDSVTTRPRRDYTSEIDINTADVRALARLPGIGTTLARRIIEEREKNGSFLSLIDLQRVNGIGPRKAAMLSGWVTFTKPQLAVDSSETP